MTTGYHPDKLAKLPIWAQDHIRQLTQQIAEAEKHLRTVRHEDVSDHRDGIGLELGYRSGKQFTYIQTDLSSVRFNGVNVYVQLDGKLCVSAQGVLRVLPQAANSVVLEPAP